MKIAIAVQQGLTSPSEKTDDGLLKAALESRGIQVDLIDWRDDTIDLKQYESIVVSSTWNAPSYPDEFLAWIDRCDEGRKRLINSAEILKLSLNKDQYLGLLIAQFGTTDSPEGCITPSLFIKPGEDTSLFTKRLDTLKKANPLWLQNLVIKPIISADGKNTYILTDNPALLKKNPKMYHPLAQAEQCIEKLLAQDGTRGIIIQPFIPAVEKSGEYQLVFIDEQFSHATVKPKGFKNNNTAERKAVPADELPPGMLAFAQNIMSFYFLNYPDSIARTRLDFFAGENGPILCEAEMVEPNTNIRRLAATEQAVALERYASSVINHSQQLNTMAMLQEFFKEDRTDYLPLTRCPELYPAMTKIYETHHEILAHLAPAKTKHQLAVAHSPAYLKACFDALNTYAQTDAPQPQDKKILLESLDDAKNHYSKSVLADDQSQLSRIIRWMLKGVVNFIASLTLGAAHYINYQKTGTATFFAHTTSDNKLKQAHHELKKEMEHSLISSPGKPSSGL